MTEWHYGTLGPVWHEDYNGGKMEWYGRHGRMTSNPNLICDECVEDHRLNYPGYPLPKYTP